MAKTRIRFVRTSSVAAPVSIQAWDCRSMNEKPVPRKGGAAPWMAAALASDPKTMRTSASSISLRCRSSPCAKVSRLTCPSRCARNAPSPRCSRANDRKVPVRSWLRDPPFSRIRLPVRVSRISVKGPSRLTLLGSQTATAPRGRARRDGRPPSTSCPKDSKKAPQGFPAPGKPSVGPLVAANPAGTVPRMAPRSPLHSAMICECENGRARAVRPNADSK